MTATAPPTVPSRKAGRFTQDRSADLEELVVEIQARIDYQIADHARQSRLLVEDRGREAVEDRRFDAAASNVLWHIDRGSATEHQREALTRLLAIHQRDEEAEDQLIAALLSMLGVHNADAHDLRRLVKANREAITDGGTVELEPAIPAHLLERQRNGNGKAGRA